MPSGDVKRTVEAVWRIESARLIAGLARIVRDVGLAEELAQDALVAALEQWPRDGVPDNPGAWLMAAARNRAVDASRRARREREVLAGLAGPAGGDGALAHEDQAPAELGDDVLRLMFMSCHPVLSPDARTALTLRLLAGLTTDEIARAYLVPEPTIAQRIVRAKRTLAEQRVAFELPDEAGLATRLQSVLEVLYLVFNEGYASTAGAEWTRIDLCEEALRLGRVLAEQMPGAGEVHGLVALMELQASRLGARRGASGDPVLLLEQDRMQWNRLLIARGLEALARAEAASGLAGPYRLQAAIAACHARAADAAATDWPRIVDLYGQLADVAPSPIVALNRAVAVAMAHGPEPALYLVEALARDPALACYHLLPSVRAWLLARLGRREDAQREFERAAAMTRNDGERLLLQRRADDCARSADPLSFPCRES